MALQVRTCGELREDGAQGLRHRECWGMKLRRVPLKTPRNILDSVPEV